MKRLIKIQLLLIFTLIILNIAGYITYGKGLGDIVYLGKFIFFTFLIMYFMYIEKKEYKMTFISITILIIYNICLLTIFRGSEYPWNGKIFREIMFQ